MASKRPRESNALVYFVDAVARLAPDPQAARHPRAALDRARVWGEAMVRAELDSLRTEGVTAAARFSHLGHSAKRWFARGCQLYLLPNAPDAPAHLHEWRGELPPQLRDQTPYQLRAIGAQEVEDEAAEADPAALGQRVAELESRVEELETYVDTVVDEIQARFDTLAARL